MLCCAVLLRGKLPGRGRSRPGSAGLKARYAADLGHWLPGAGRRISPPKPRQPLTWLRRPTATRSCCPCCRRKSARCHARREGASGDLAEWHRRLLKLRQDQAAALFALAQRCVRRHQASLAYRLALEAIKADPDHEAARRVFGYQKYQNQWHTPYEVLMLRSGMVWHEKFGWIEKADLPRYERGERLFGVTWIDAANDAALHAEITTGWDIETEHYRIRTNHSIEAAVALGVKLENLHRLWRQIFLGYYSSEADVEALFSGRPPAQVRTGIAAAGRRLLPRQGTVPSGLEADHARRRHLDGRFTCPRTARPISMPAAKTASGPCITRPRTSFSSNRGGPSSDDVGRKANCWLIEGIAMYMETLRREGDCFVLGGLDDVRMEAARYHLEKKDFYVPFDKLVRMGVQDVQGHPQIAKLYSQIAAMTSFLVHYDDGRYRDALVSCLAAIYDGSQDPDLLARATGTSYAELDKQYQDYMKISAEFIAKESDPLSKLGPLTTE